MPSLLVFGMLPRIPVGTDESASRNQLERMRAMNTARYDMDKVTAELRIRSAMKYNMPKSVLDEEFVSEGMLVLVYRKNLKYWDGPYELIGIVGKTVYIKDTHGNSRPFPSTNVKKYYVSNDVCPDENESSGNNVYVNITETIEPWEVTQQVLEDFKGAIKDEIDGLFGEGTFEKTAESEISDDANIMGSRFVLTIKNIGTETERKKARLVAQGHKDNKKDVIVNDCPTLMKFSFRLILFLTSLYSLKLCSRDVRQAYLQSESNSQREVHIKPPRGWKDQLKGYLLKVIKPLHGITEAGSYWIDAYLNFFLNDLETKGFVLDPCLLYLVKNSQLVGISGMVVDDTTEAVIEEFIKTEDEKCERFRMTPKQVGEFDFSGVHVKQDHNVISTEQIRHISSIEVPKAKEMNSKKFATLRGKLVWRSYSTRPDVAYFTGILSQVKANECEDSDGKILRKAIRKLREQEVSLRYPQIDKETM